MCRILCALLIVVGTALPLSAQSVRLLEHHDDALRARVEAIRAAQESIELSTFIIESDDIGLGLMAELRAASLRGVEVRVLLDAGYNRLDRRVLGHLLSEGVAIREYHPFRPLKPLWITRRLHDKILLVDGEVLILGGRNVSNPYFGIGAKTYTDRDVWVQGGEAVRHARGYFEDLWESEHVAEKLGAFHPRWLEVRCVEGASGEQRVRQRRCERKRAVLEHGLSLGKGRLDEALAGLEERTRGLEDRNWSGSLFALADNSVRFVFDAIGAKSSRPGTAHALREVFAGAEERVLIETPYLVPSRAFRRALRESHRSGVAVRILTNSLNTTDNLWPQAGYVGEKRWLQRHGVELWEQIGVHTLHSKSAVLDQETVIVGSFNLDPRSEKLNREVLLVIESPQLAQELAESMDGNLESAWQIDEQGRPVGYDERYPGIGWLKKCKLRMLRMITPFLRKQL